MPTIHNFLKSDFKNQSKIAYELSRLLGGCGGYFVHFPSNSLLKAPEMVPIENAMIEICVLMPPQDFQAHVPLLPKSTVKFDENQRDIIFATHEYLTQDPTVGFGLLNCVDDTANCTQACRLPKEAVDLIWISKETHGINIDEVNENKLAYLCHQYAVSHGYGSAYPTFRYQDHQLQIACIKKSAVMKLVVSNKLLTTLSTLPLDISPELRADLQNQLFSFAAQVVRERSNGAELIRNIEKYKTNPALSSEYIQRYLLNFSRVKADLLANSAAANQILFSKEFPWSSLNQQQKSELFFAATQRKNWVAMNLLLAKGADLTAQINSYHFLDYAMRVQDTTFYTECQNLYSIAEKRITACQILLAVRSTDFSEVELLSLVSPLDSLESLPTDNNDLNALEYALQKERSQLANLIWSKISDSTKSNALSSLFKTVDTHLKSSQSRAERNALFTSWANKLVEFAITSNRFTDIPSNVKNLWEMTEMVTLRNSVRTQVAEQQTYQGRVDQHAASLRQLRQEVQSINAEARQTFQQINSAIGILLGGMNQAGARSSESHSNSGGNPGFFGNS